MPDYKKEYLEPAVKIKQMAGSFLLRVSNSVWYTEKQMEVYGMSA